MKLYFILLVCVIDLVLSDKWDSLFINDMKDGFEWEAMWGVKDNDDLQKLCAKLSIDPNTNPDIESQQGDVFPKCEILKLSKSAAPNYVMPNEAEKKTIAGDKLQCKCNNDEFYLIQHSKNKNNYFKLYRSSQLSNYMYIGQFFMNVEGPKTFYDGTDFNWFPGRLY